MVMEHLLHGSFPLSTSHHPNSHSRTGKTVPIHHGGPPGGSTRNGQTHLICGGDA